MSAIQISTLTGHLTAANKRAISQMLEHGMAAARTPKIRYYLMPESEEVQKVVVEWNESNDWGELVERRSSATFSVTRRGTAVPRVLEEAR